MVRQLYRDDSSKRGVHAVIHSASNSASFGGAGDRLRTFSPALYHVAAETYRSVRRLAARAGGLRTLSPRAHAHVRATKWYQSARHRLGPKLFRLAQHRPRPLRLPQAYYDGQPTFDLPTIAVTTPTLRHGRFIERTIKSVLGQGYPNLQYVVKDGGSKDGTVEVLRRYDRQLDHWESAGDTGQAQAINVGFESATGEIMAYLNSDDLYLPGTLAFVGRFFREHEEVDVVYGHRIVIDEEDRQIGRWILPRHDDELLAYVDYVPQETLFWRRRAWEKVGGYIDESFQFALDWDLLLRFRAARLRMIRLPRFLGAFRVSREQKTASQMATIGIREMNRLRRRYLGEVPSESEIKERVARYILRHWAIDALYATGIVPG